MTSSSKSVNVRNNNHSPTLIEADRLRVLNAIGNLASINPEAIPMSLPTNYLHNSQLHPTCNSTQSAPPPLPPRADLSRMSVDRFNRFPNYNNCYSPYSRFSPGMYNPTYGNYRTPYNRYNGPPDTYNSFIQLAEESTRPAFESIESVVDIVGSISMMLESTYHAVYSSYSAILGVVDQFSRLKDHLAEVLSFLALLRGLKYLCLKVLYFLRLRKDNPSIEAAWNTAQSAAGSDSSIFPDDAKSPWPFFMFISLVIGAPWLMFKLLSKSAANKKPLNIKSWKEKNGRIMASYAAYDFNTNRRGEISFKTGDLLYLAPKNLQKSPKGWVLACNTKNKAVGLVPQNYLVSQPASVAPTAVRSQSNVEKQKVPEDFADKFAKLRKNCKHIGNNAIEPSDPSTSDKGIISNDAFESCPNNNCNSTGSSGEDASTEESVKSNQINHHDSPSSSKGNISPSGNVPNLIAEEPSNGGGNTEN